MTIADNEHGNISSIPLVKSQDYGDAIQYMQGAIDLTKKNFDFINITLSEVQRVGAIKLSGTPGGDGTAAFLHVASGGVLDRSDNPECTLSTAFLRIRDHCSNGRNPRYHKANN